MWLILPRPHRQPCTSKSTASASCPTSWPSRSAARRPTLLLPRRSPGDALPQEEGRRRRRSGAQWGVYHKVPRRFCVTAVVALRPLCAHAGDQSLATALRERSTSRCSVWHSRCRSPRRGPRVPPTMHDVGERQVTTAQGPATAPGRSLVPDWRDLQAANLRQLWLLRRERTCALELERLQLRGGDRGGDALRVG